jgi:photosystem II stability/assembly factor-like uncharacterized protein
LLDKANVLYLRIDPQDSQTVYAGTPGLGLLRSENGGDNWSRNQANFTRATDIFINPQNSQQMYALAQIPEVGGRVLHSTDGGNNWKEVFTDQTGQASVLSFAMDPTNPRVLYIGDSEGGIYKSINQGETWKNLMWARSGIKKIEISPVDPQVIYFATVSSGALRTDTGGETSGNSGANGSEKDGGNGIDELEEEEEDDREGAFTSLNTGSKVYNIVAHPYKKKVVYISDSEGVRRSDDLGMNWKTLNTLVKPENLATRGLAINPQNDQIIYLASRNVFYKSTDGGDTWKPIPLHIDRIIKVIELNPDHPQEIYLGTYKLEEGGFKLFPF